MTTFPTGTVTLLFTDIEGSSTLWDSHRSEMAVALVRHNDLMVSLIAEHGGAVVRDKGDGYFAAFPSPQRAVACALAAQRGLRDAAWPEAIGELRVRMGMHTGGFEAPDGDYQGPVVNRVARIEGLAHGGQVLLSEATRALLRDDLPDSVSLRDLGWHPLRGMSEPEHVYQLVAPDLPDEFPPLVSAAPAGVGLPTFPTTFIGRESERTAIAELFASPDCRLVTLVGPGGIGKTRLAVEAARPLASRLPGGARFADLAPAETTDDVGRAIAEAVGAHPEGAASLMTLAAARITAPTLLVIDNFEHVRPAAADVGRLLAEAPELRILTTSRSPLHLRGEHLYRVEPLGAFNSNGRTPPAVELFYDRAASYGVNVARDGPDAAAVRSICRRLDGLPLAIELVAARARAIDVVELDGLLGRSLNIIGVGSADLPERQRTIRATIDWSLDSVSDRQRSLFSLLSIFPAGATVDQLASVAGLDPAELLDELIALVDNSLVHVARGLPGGTRYRQLVPLREHGLELLHKTGGYDPAMGGLVDHYSAVAPELGRRIESDEAVHAELLVDQPNLVAAMRWSLGAGRAGDVATLTNQIWAYWFDGDRAGALMEWLDQAGPMLDGAGVDWLRGFVGFMQGDYEAAAGRMMSAAAVFEETGDEEGLARARAFAGALAPDPEAGRALLQHSFDYFDARDAGLSRYLAGMFLGLNSLQRGEVARSIEQITELLDWSEQAGYELLEAYAHVNLAVSLIFAGDLDAAERHNRRCLEFMIAGGYQEGLAGSADLVAFIAARRGDTAHALRILGASEAVFARLQIARWPPAQVLFAETMAAAREELGEAEVARLLAEGEALGLDDFIELVSI